MRTSIKKLRELRDRSKWDKYTSSGKFDIPKCKKTVSGKHHWSLEAYIHDPIHTMKLVKRNYPQCIFCNLIDDRKEKK